MGAVGPQGSSIKGDRGLQGQKGLPGRDGQKGQKLVGLTQQRGANDFNQKGGLKSKSGIGGGKGQKVN